ncbi:MAG: knotted carbamoyltransferase YgeW [Spirochaetales bacterium]|nr:knotted carbamoyltransferase YgeW [Spirochaetales bacterium]
MELKEIQKKIDTLLSLKSGQLYQSDFLLSWDKREDEIRAVLTVAEILQMMREQNISPRIFDSGLAVAIFRDKSTRTRFSFLSAANLLGLAAQDLDETKTQIAHGETVRETANMISFLTEIIGIRDDMYLGYGNTYMKEVSEAVREGHREGALPRIPTLVNLQCDIDHPTQSLSDLLHLSRHFGSLEALKGKKIAMTWAYSPSYGKPLSVPQGVIALMSRFGMKVSLAYPEGYSLIPEVEDLAEKNSQASGGAFHKTHSMAEAFADADIVYPKSWAPYDLMQRRTELLKAGDSRHLDELETECLELNKRYIDWVCNEELMERTKDALYLHCLPADISGVSCEHGEVAGSVFERFRLATYRQAGNKPYIIAAMMFLSKVKKPTEVLSDLLQGKPARAS